MALQGNKKDYTLKDLLDKSCTGVDGKVNEDAVNAGLYIISVFETWEELSPQVADSDLLDTIVLMILNSEGHLAVPHINGLADKLTDTAVAAEILKFISSLMSKEIVRNTFIQQYGNQLEGAIFQSAANEVARRKLKGSAWMAANADKWQVLVAISAKAAGAGRAMQLSMNLKEVFSGSN